MKILLIHADFIEFEAKKKAIKQAEEGIKEGKQRVDECLVVFTAVEKRDEQNVRGVIQRYVQEIKDVATQVKVKNIVLYPYAHLSSQLASAAVAEQVLRDAEKILKKEFTVSRAPFGWYKAFTLQSKGHPLSELSREFGPESGQQQPAFLPQNIRATEKDDPQANPTYRKLLDFLDKNKAEYKLIGHAPEGRTEIVSPLRGNTLAQAAKCMVVMVKLGKDDKKFILGVVPGDAKINLAVIKQLFQGTYVSFATKDVAEQLAASVSGTILPFSFNPKLELIVDPRLLENEELYFNAARLDRSMVLKKNDYVRLAKPRLEKIAEYSQPLVGDIKNSREVSSLEEPFDREMLLKKLSKQNMSAEPARNGLKSNVELGKELDLYIVNEVIGSGLPLLTPRGATIRREIERFIVDEELKRGYLHTSTPVLAKSDLYKISGHWQHYKDNMFVLPVGEEVFALRPMTCPFHFTIYKSKSRSYRELPLRYAEIASLFRNEKSGELMGLTRIRQFTLADAHLICRPDQLEEEFATVVDLIHYVAKTLKMDGLWYRFSKWDPQNKEKYVDNPPAWASTQATMKKILDRLNIKYIEAENEAAFYGPKLDVQYKNVFGKEDTLLTVQIDFGLPENFDLTYVDEHNEKKRAMVIHRSSVGCLERTMAYLLEKTQGNLPLWLNPLQVKIVTVNDASIAFAREVERNLEAGGIRIEIDDNTETMGRKVREAQLQKVNYILTIGDQEVEKKVLAVRTRAGEIKFNVPVKEFLAQLLKEIEDRK